MATATSAAAASVSRTGALDAVRAYLLAALTGTLVFLPYVEPRLFIVGWFAFVPLLFALEGRSLGQSWLLGAIAGSVAWIGAAYWLTDFLTLAKEYSPPWNYLGAIVYWLYAGQAFALIALAFQWLRTRSRLPEPLLFPLVFVAVFSLYPVLFQSRIGEGQSLFLLGIQAVELTGVHGLDFVMALTSALCYCLIRRPPTRQRGALIASGALLAAWFGYGLVTLQAWGRQIESWPTVRIGLVQPNDPPSIAVPPLPPGYSRTQPPEMAASRRLAAAGAELVIWPEARYKGYYYQENVRREYQRQVAEMGVPLLFHDVERHRNGARSRYYNTATVLNEQGQPAGSYRKIKRVAFGEYLPVVSQLPLLRGWVEGYLGDFLREISPGDEHVTIEASGMRLVPKICYESAFPGFVASAIGADALGKLLVFQSQDNWFGETNQPFMHLHSSILRAVENRVPMVHAINNGPSAAVRPDGRIVARTEAFTRTEQVVALPYSAQAGGSFYSRNPGLFLHSIYALSVLIVVTAVAGPLRRR